MSPDAIEVTLPYGVDVKKSHECIASIGGTLVQRGRDWFIQAGRNPIERVAHLVDGTHGRSYEGWPTKVWTEPKHAARFAAKAEALLTDLLQTTETSEWCLTRWMIDKKPISLCGPLSLMINGDERGGSPESFSMACSLGNVGFPHGKIGRVLRFATEEEACELGSLASQVSIDVPVPLHEIMFWAETHSYYDGGDVRLCEPGTPFARAQALVQVAKAAMHGLVGSDYFDAEVKCEPSGNAIFRAQGAVFKKHHGAPP